MKKTHLLSGLSLDVESLSIGYAELLKRKFELLETNATYTGSNLSHIRIDETKELSLSKKYSLGKKYSYSNGLLLIHDSRDAVRWISEVPLPRAEVRFRSRTQICSRS